MMLYKTEISQQTKIFIGDIRDKDRVKLALENVIVVHAAALKQVPSAEKIHSKQ